MDSKKVKHILVLNGWSMASEIWDSFFASVLPGFSYDVLSLSTQTTLEECNDLINSHIKPDTLIIGWSLGGEIALNYLIHYQGERVRKSCVVGVVFLQSTPCFVNQDSWQAGVSCEDFDALQHLLGEKSLDKLVRRFSYLMLAGSKFKKEDRRLLTALYSTDSLPTIECLSFGLELLKSFDFRASLADLELPFIWILGENDSLVSANSDSFETLFSQKTLCGSLSVIKGMGHFPCGQHAQEIMQEIILFTEGL